MKRRLGEILIAEGKLDQAQLKSGLSYQRRWGKKLGDCLVDLGFLTEVEIIHALARALRLPMIDITRIDSSKITLEILDMISLQVARRNRIVPLAIKVIHRKKRLVIATSDPTNYTTLDEIQFKAGLPLLIMLAPDGDIDWFIRKYYMSDTEALPENYVSGISLIEPRDSIDEGGYKIETDPVSNIFFDEDFTGVSRVYSQQEKDKKKKD